MEGTKDTESRAGGGADACPAACPALLAVLFQLQVRAPPRYANTGGVRLPGQAVTCCVKGKRLADELLCHAGGACGPVTAAPREAAASAATAGWRACAYRRLHGLLRPCARHARDRRGRSRHPSPVARAAEPGARCRDDPAAARLGRWGGGRQGGGRMELGGRRLVCSRRACAQRGGRAAAVRAASLAR